MAEFHNLLFHSWTADESFDVTMRPMIWIDLKLFVRNLSNTVKWLKMKLFEIYHPT